MNCLHVSLLLLLSCLTACASSTARYEDHLGRDVAFELLVEDCADKDVVFFGESHQNDHCHEEQRRLMQALVERRKDVALTMEMFERDVQDKIDAYLAGKLPEADFRKQARAWPNWHHYRPLLQIAAAHGLPVLAGNPPKQLSLEVFRGGGLEAVEGKAHVAKEIEAPKDAYFEKIVEMMTSKPFGPDNDGSAWMNLYYSQVVKDETMAETIVEFLRQAHAEGRRPLVLHVNGSVHSAGRLGVPMRVSRRMPDLKLLGIETEVVGDDDKAPPQLVAGDYRLFVTRTRKPRAERVHPKPKEKHPTHPETAHPKPKHPAQPKTETEHAGDEQRRPGLGFMPDYEGEGVGVALVGEGSAAAKAGIQAGDRILELDGEELEDLRHYSEVLGGLKIGSKVKVVIDRKGKQMTLDVVVGESRR